METKNLKLIIQGRMNRALQGKKPEQVALESGISKSTLSKYLNGQLLPGPENLIRFSTATGVSIHWLLTEEGPMEREVVKAIHAGEVNLEQIELETIQKFLRDQLNECTKKEKVLRAKHDVIQPKEKPA